MPVPAEQAFLFTEGPQPPVQARTLKQFTEALSHATVQSISGYLNRHDFSRWVDAVFGDYTLAAQIEALEKQNGSRHEPVLRDAIIRLIEERYALGQPEREPTTSG